MNKDAATNPSQVTFYSIGENCLGHGVLKRHGVDVQATPFSHARSNIDYATQLVQADFKGMLRRSALRHEDRYRTRVVVNTTYSCDPDLYDRSVSDMLEFSHHDVIGDEAARASYRRKAARFLGALHGEGAACFVYHYRWHRRQDIDRVAEKLSAFRELCSERATRPVSVAMFTQRIVSLPGDRGVSMSVRHGIPVAVLSTLKAWGGRDMDVFWARSDDDLFAPVIAEFQMHAAEALMPQRAGWLHAIKGAAATMFRRRA